MFDQASWHPIIVHTPLVLIPAAVVFALLDLFRPSLGLRLAGLILLAAGVGGAALATQTGKAAQHQAERVSRQVERIPADGPLADTVGNGRLLRTHAALGEMTRNVYGLLLLAEGALLFATLPVFSRLRRGRTLAARWQRVGRGAWVFVAGAGLVLVVLTGHYGGSLVYDHGVGVDQGAGVTRSP